MQVSHKAQSTEYKPHSVTIVMESKDEAAALHSVFYNPTITEVLEEFGVDCAAIRTAISEGAAPNGYRNYSIAYKKLKRSIADESNI